MLDKIIGWAQLLGIAFLVFAVVVYVASGEAGPRLSNALWGGLAFAGAYCIWRLVAYSLRRRKP